jgi:hypothetical protein
MVTHSYCRSWQSVTSSVLQECWISAVLVRTLGIYYNSEMFHFKFMNRIRNSIPNLKVTSEAPSKNSSHNFCTPVFGRENWPTKCENYASIYGTSSCFLQVLYLLLYCYDLGYWSFHWYRNAVGTM